MKIENRQTEKQQKKRKILTDKHDEEARRPTNKQTENCQHDSN